jgi:hypothetical protein
LFMSSLPFDEFLDTDLYWKGYVTLKKNVTCSDLSSDNSETMQVIVDGINHQTPFELKP